MCSPEDTGLTKLRCTSQSETKQNGFTEAQLPPQFRSLWNRPLETPQAAGSLHWLPGIRVRDVRRCKRDLFGLFVTRQGRRLVNRVGGPRRLVNRVGGQQILCKSAMCSLLHFGLQSFRIVKFLVQVPHKKTGHQLDLTLWSYFASHCSRASKTKNLAVNACKEKMTFFRQSLFCPKNNTQENMKSLLHTMLQ